MSFETLRWENAGGLGALTLARPPVNVLNLQMMEEIRHAFAEALDDPSVRVLLIRGDGKHFSAGADVGDHLPEKVGRMFDLFGGLFRDLEAMEIPVVAAVHGAVMGGGLELASYADIVVARADAKLGQPEIQLAVFPPVAAAHLPRRIGWGRTMDMVLTGRTLTAQDALAAGLVDRVLPVEAFEIGVRELVDGLLGLSGAALRMAKRAVRAAAGRPGVEGIEAAERIYIEELMKTEDAVAGLHAFLEKRRPEWKHA